MFINQPFPSKATEYVGMRRKTGFGRAEMLYNMMVARRAPPISAGVSVVFPHPLLMRLRQGRRSDKFITFIRVRLSGANMFKKISLLVLALIGVFFAGTYTEYCLDQTDPCFQSNCYKVNGEWATNPDTGKVDCMYDTASYTDEQINSAFATCIAESARCEQDMESGSSYTYTPSGSSGSSSSACCGSAFVLLGVVGFSCFAQMRK
jgi:hypothetical protein